MNIPTAEEMDSAYKAVVAERTKRELDAIPDRREQWEKYVREQLNAAKKTERRILELTFPLAPSNWDPELTETLDRVLMPEIELALTGLGFRAQANIPKVHPGDRTLTIRW